ncbi:MAG: signal peptidase II [Oscillospiraceae bacterium]|nr:signal peptidase II [Oscillospiraceae bacterium]
MKNKKYLWMTAGIFDLIIIDQIIKFLIIRHLYRASISVIEGVLDLTYVENTGAAFGLGADGTIPIIVLNIIIIAILIRFVIIKKEKLSKPTIVRINFSFRWRLK